MKNFFEAEHQQPTSLLFIRCHGNLPVLRYSRFVSASRTGTWFPGDRCCSPTHPGRPPERPSTIRTRNKSKYWLIYRPLTAHWSALLIRVRANSLFSWRSETKSIKFLRWLCMKSGKFVLKKILSLTTEKLYVGTNSWNVEATDLDGIMQSDKKNSFT